MDIHSKAPGYVISGKSGKSSVLSESQRIIGHGINNSK